MRKCTIALNTVVATFFVCFVGYTFLARQHLDGLARDFVTERTLTYAEPLVDAADESIDSQFLQTLLSERQIAAIRTEIDQFHGDPSSYIADLTRKKELDRTVQSTNPLMQNIATYKVRIRDFYDATLDALINDLRIFSASNLCASLVALWTACRPQQTHKSVVSFSLLMFAAVVYCSFLYIDNLSFFRILFRSHMGWWYPVTLCAVVIGFHLEYAHSNKPSRPETDGNLSPAKS